jgi:AcrR family transcriptional regulator
MPDTYHHGSLRRTILDQAAELIAEAGPDALSLRELARRAGVSHAAPAHHFVDRSGLLIALAAEGFTRLGDVMVAVAGDMKATAVAYVRFAVTNPGHYQVMFRRDLLTGDDADLVAARSRTTALLAAGVRSVDPDKLRVPLPVAGLAAWSLVHGFASLWLDRSIEGVSEVDPGQMIGEIAEQLFG